MLLKISILFMFPSLSLLWRQALLSFSSLNENLSLSLGNVKDVIMLCASIENLQLLLPSVYRKMSERIQPTFNRHLGGELLEELNTRNIFQEVIEDIPHVQYMSVREIIMKTGSVNQNYIQATF